jgi:hypothetical protein
VRDSDVVYCSDCGAKMDVSKMEITTEKGEK